MNIRYRFSLLAVAGLLTLGPVYAQSDNGGALPQSDVSGNVSQSDLIVFQSDEARIRMNDVASTLTQALRQGVLGASVVKGSQQLSVSPTVSDLFGVSSRKDADAATQSFSDALSAQGLPSTESKALAEAVTGLLDGGAVSPEQFVDALTAYNAAVDAAPTSFLVQPPQDFIVVRAVLMSLLEGTV